MSAAILLVGAGPMAVDYAKVLRAEGVQPVVVGRGADSAAKAATGITAAQGGLDAWLSQAGAPPARAIVATGEKWIGAATRTLIEHGVRQVLVEKPGGHDAGDIRRVAEAAARARAQVFVGYNRRFYASVDAAKRFIAQDGGVSSFHFEFTEWGHVIEGLAKEDGVKEEWFLANSSHVIDLAFHLGGAPVQMTSFVAGKLAWHPAGARFAGAGSTQPGALFSYNANWEAPGRWGVEILTRERRLILRPLERLQVQKKGSVAIDFAEIDDAADKEFKPGLKSQVKAFLAGDAAVLPTIAEQAAMLPWYARIRDGGGAAR
jgi:predicted dehydrogenase